MSKNTIKLALLLCGLSQSTAILTLDHKTPSSDLPLYNYFKNLDPDNSDLRALIKNSLDTQNQDVINFIITQTDHINLAVNIFKKHFTPEEITCILDFHTSATGQKFSSLFPAIMTEYSQELDHKINTIKLAVIAYAKK